jgi:serine/threonine protein kinase
MTVPTSTELLDRLRVIYEKEDLGDQFREESEVYRSLLPDLLGKLSEKYDVLEPFALGSTATVWRVQDVHLEQERALKLPRPRMARLRNIISVVRAERVRLASLNHQNLIKVYFADEVPLTISDEPYSFPFFIMDFLKHVRDLDHYIIENRRSLTGDKIVELFRDIAHGLAFLHKNEVIHCDVKPGNLLIASGTPALIADLGYSKYLPRMRRTGDSLTQITFTEKFAHPDLRERIIESSDPNAIEAKIERRDLREAFDLFAFGRSIQEVLIQLRAAEAADPELRTGVERRSVLSEYQWLYLGFVSKRLLDGRVEKLGSDDLSSDLIPGLTERVMEEIKYRDAEEASEDLEKLLKFYDLEGAVPELNPETANYIQISHFKVPLTKRVRAIVNHSTFQRLRQVTQLGFVSLVYPGAVHTRYEHALGTFASCCRYLRSLWYDEVNCLFQSIMSARDLELTLLASLLHDLAQYPMAHDLTEVSGNFAHERFTRQVAERSDTSMVPLAEVIRRAWKVEIEDVLRILNSGKDSALRDRILNSVLSGPLDCDKLDYLQRDSTHLGVSFGLVVDQERLLRNLTTVYDSTAETVIGPDGYPRSERRLRVAEIGIREKGLTVATAVLRARQDMFRQVYWQHTVRALKAMLGYVVRGILVNTVEEDARAEFWWRFQEAVFSGRWTERATIADSANGTAAGDSPENGDVLIGDVERKPSPVWSGLSVSDDALLQFLRQFADENGKRMIDAIRSRAVYRRLAVLSGARMPEAYDSIYKVFWAYRVGEKYKEIEEDRRRWQDAILDEVDGRLHSDPALVPEERTADMVLEELERVEPLILVDVPVKATGRIAGQRALWHLPEEFGEVHSREIRAFPRFAPVSVDVEQESFDKQVGKIRVLAAPKWIDLLTRCVAEDRVLEIIGS